MTPKTKKAERNAKREEFTRAALLYCAAQKVCAFEDAAYDVDRSPSKGIPDSVFHARAAKAKSHFDMLKAYHAMEEK